MTRSQRGFRLWKNNRWLGRILSCVLWRREGTRSYTVNSSCCSSSSDVDLPQPASEHRHHLSPADPISAPVPVPVSARCRQTLYSSTTVLVPCESYTELPSPPSPASDNNNENVVLLSIRSLSTPTATTTKTTVTAGEVAADFESSAVSDQQQQPVTMPVPVPVPAAMRPMTAPTSVSIKEPLGELEMALYAESLLEFRDWRASIPVLNIGYGFTDRELKALSKYTPSSSSSSSSASAAAAGVGIASAASPAKGGDCRKTEPWQCGLAAAPDGLWSDACYLEPLIDGLPASVWLECVEPTLSILISLNSLRRRRSNLSLKKGIPEPTDTNRIRHGDFELGPIAIFQHQPGRLQQMMLLRVEYLDAAANAAVSNNPNNNVNQSADHTGRRGCNRHRRFRHIPLDEFSLGNISNVSNYLNEPSTITETNYGNNIGNINSNNNNNGSGNSFLSCSKYYGLEAVFDSGEWCEEENTSLSDWNLPLPAFFAQTDGLAQQERECQGTGPWSSQLHTSMSLANRLGDVQGVRGRSAYLLPPEIKVDVMHFDRAERYVWNEDERSSRRFNISLKVQDAEFSQASAQSSVWNPQPWDDTLMDDCSGHDPTRYLNWNSNAGHEPEMTESLLDDRHEDATVLPPSAKQHCFQADECQEGSTTKPSPHAATPKSRKGRKNYRRLVGPGPQNSSCQTSAMDWKEKLRAAIAFLNHHRPAPFRQGYERQTPVQDDGEEEEEKDRNNSARPGRRTAASPAAAAGAVDFLNGGDLGLLTAAPQCPPHLEHPPALICPANPVPAGGPGTTDSSANVLGSLVIASAALILGTSVCSPLPPVSQPPGQPGPPHHPRPLSRPAPACSNPERREGKEEEGGDEEEEGHEDGGDNVLKVRIPATSTTTTSTTTTTPTNTITTTTTTTTSTQRPSPDPSSSRLPSPATVATSTSTTTNITTIPSTTTTSTTTTCPTTTTTTTTQPMDVLAFGDSALWAPFPNDGICYLPSRYLGTLVPSHQGTAAAATARSRSPARRHLFSYPRTLVRRARGALFRWRVRLERAKIAARKSRDPHRRL